MIVVKALRWEFCFAKLHLDTPSSWFLALIISSLLSAGVGLSAEVHMEEH
jgi:hypothetical protein